MTQEFHTPATLAKILQGLSELAINAVPIGSVASGYSSRHDIDILVLDTSDKRVRDSLKQFFEPFSSLSHTDWGGYLFRNTRFGNVDIFFLDILFDLATTGDPMMDYSRMKPPVYVDVDNRMIEVEQ